MNRPLLALPSLPPRLALPPTSDDAAWSYDCPFCGQQHACNDPRLHLLCPGDCEPTEVQA